MKNITERRKHQRFEALRNVLAINSLGFGQVTNMSMGGLRIKYLLRSNESFDLSFTLSLLNNAGDQCIDSLPCQVVSFRDSEPFSPPLTLFIRETRVMFTHLTSEQKNLLADFLLRNTRENCNFERCDLHFHQHHCYVTS